MEYLASDEGHCYDHASGGEGKALNNLKIYVLRILSVKEKIKAYLS